jgi:hypothetical protein
VVGLHVRLEDRDDWNALSVGQAYVLVDEIYVRVHDRERALRLAAQQVGGAGAVVVE